MITASCRLQGVDPYRYLVDVLQRVETRPMSQVELLTPRLWKKNFADDPLRSAIDRRFVNASACPVTPLHQVAGGNSVFERGLVERRALGVGFAH